MPLFTSFEIHVGVKWHISLILKEDIRVDENQVIPIQTHDKCIIVKYLLIKLIM